MPWARSSSRCRVMTQHRRDVGAGGGGRRHRGRARRAGAVHGALHRRRVAGARAVSHPSAAGTRARARHALTFAVTAVPAHLVAGLPWVQEMLVAAVLAPTGPVLAMAIVGHPEVRHEVALAAEGRERGSTAVSPCPSCWCCCRCFSTTRSRRAARGRAGVRRGVRTVVPAAAVLLLRSGSPPRHRRTPRSAGCPSGQSCTDVPIVHAFARADQRPEQGTGDDSRASGHQVTGPDRPR